MMTEIQTIDGGQKIISLGRPIFKKKLYIYFFQSQHILPRHRGLGEECTTCTFFRMGGGIESQSLLFLLFVSEEASREET